MTTSQRITSLVVSLLLMTTFSVLVINAPNFTALRPEGFSSSAWEQANAALSYVGVASLGLVLLFGFEGSSNIKAVAQGVFLGVSMPPVAALAGANLLPSSMPQTLLHAGFPPSIGAASGMAVCLFVASFAFRVLIAGNLAFPSRRPTRAKGRRAVHGESTWMAPRRAQTLFSQRGGIVIGEASRPDLDDVAGIGFDPHNPRTWGQGGRVPLLCFDASFGSTHGLIFAGSGGFKTTSSVIPTALKFKGTLVVLDPSREVAPMVAAHRRKHGQIIFTLDPQTPDIGFNVLDWIGRHGNTPEQDIAAVAGWIMSERPTLASGSDDFFRTSAQQLITAIIADVVLGPPGQNVDPNACSLRVVRQRLAQPEEALKKALADMHEHTTSRFVREIVAPFVDMTPQTFSGVYGTAAKETHWLSYENYASLVSGSSFRSDDIGQGNLSVFINLDLSTLENHSGIARVIIGALLMAVYNRGGQINERALFLFDEAARLGYMRILETARDAGRKYGISLVLLFQSLGQMRQAFGGRDATSKWFESSSWISFAAINDTDTAHYVSQRCGMTTVEVSQISSTSKQMGASRTRAKQLSQRPLILPHEVTQMRADEQIVFTSGNPPLRCGRALYFRRQDMREWVASSPFGPNSHSVKP